MYKCIKIRQYVPGISRYVVKISQEMSLYRPYICSRRHNAMLPFINTHLHPADSCHGEIGG